MQLSISKFAVAALGLSNIVAAALTPAQIVDNINIITAKSQALQVPATSITLTNGPLIVVGLGPFPPIIAGFADIVRVVTSDIALMQGTPQVTAAAEVKAIADAFREFVRVHQVLLNILIGKAGLFTVVPLIGAPVSAVLRQIEGVVDSIAFSLIAIVEGTANDIAVQRQSLDGTINVSITTYNGLRGVSKKRDLENPGSASFHALRV
ncbi:hypothetical protein G7054_g10077 [Neopestalotiopsis clavispora]|nr:hypothetical protein G7054_g10077 [Neopestalotiopsis clavispora]